ncbi:MAG: 1-(5-phosphoribosyl)-5-[(5-phosphoribosylamino)methylideneamino] imidazole-4-carboxamide isomerase, partial [Deltaproteobacteria bacterium]
MIVLPAIDIRGGRCVRLVQGDYDRETVFGDDPAAMAERWLAGGARALHIVDLDGARSGSSRNRRAVQGILARVAEWSARTGAEAPVVQLGGGIRTVRKAGSWLRCGVDRVILGTAAVEDPDIVGRACARFPGRVWVGIDARAGMVAVSGWTETTSLAAVDLARQVAERGAAGIVYTDIERDGTGSGVNLEHTLEIARSVSVPVIASG